MHYIHGCNMEMISLVAEIELLFIWSISVTRQYIVPIFLIFASPYTVDGVNGRTVVVDVVHNSIERVTIHLLINVENHVRDTISDTKSPTVINIKDITITAT